MNRRGIIGATFMMFVATLAIIFILILLMLISGFVKVSERAGATDVQDNGIVKEEGLGLRTFVSSYSNALGEISSEKFYRSKGYTMVKVLEASNVK